MQHAAWVAGYEWGDVDSVIEELKFHRRFARQWAKEHADDPDDQTIVDHGLPQAK
jgi:hypothetical protein